MPTIVNTPIDFVVPDGYEFVRVYQPMQSIDKDEVLAYQSGELCIYNGTSALYALSVLKKIPPTYRFPDSVKDGTWYVRCPGGEEIYSDKEPLATFNHWNLLSANCINLHVLRRFVDIPDTDPEFLALPWRQTKCQKPFSKPQGNQDAVNAG